MERREALRLMGAASVFSALSSELFAATLRAQLAANQILVTGAAGLLAGACSMAIGEWISVQSSRELNQRQIEIEADELLEAPEEETESVVTYASIAYESASGWRKGNA